MRALCFTWFTGILAWLANAPRCPLCNAHALLDDTAFATSSVVTRCDGKGHNVERFALSVPDVQPSTFCEMSLASSSLTTVPALEARTTHQHNVRQITRTYSFVLHDHARFAHLLE